MKKLFKYCLLACLFYNHFYLSAQNMERVKKNIDTLCSKEFLGRGYVNTADKKAANWIAKNFQQLGLQSFGKNFFQPFQIPINTFPGKIALTADKKQIALGREFIVSAHSPAVKGKAKTLWLDTLIFKDNQRKTIFLQNSFKDKALVFDGKWEKQINDLPEQELKKLQAARIWVILRDKLTAAVSVEQAPPSTFEVLKSAFPANCRLVSFEIQTELIEQYTTQNVIGFIQGSIKDTFLVFTAHYDHLGAMGDVFFPGANDNASGVSMLFELADYFKNSPPKYSVCFMAFAAEEAGIIGSHYYTSFPLFPLSRIKFLVNLDLVGTGENGITVVNGAVFEKEFQLLSSLNEQKKYLPAVNRRGKAANSDHYFFTEKGVKAFFIYGLGSISAYHDVYDLASTLPLTKYKEIFRLVTDFANSF